LNSEQNAKRRRQTKRLRTVRKIHRATGVILFILLFFLSITGALLGWKKHSGGIILPETKQGLSSDLKDWLPLDSLHNIAIKAFNDSIAPIKSPKLDKIDVRKNDGIVKFVFENGYWGIQIDGTTGKVLQIQRRWSDLLENIHDGSLLDNIYGTQNGFFKLIVTSMAGIGILTFVITGFWIWYGPKMIRKQRSAAEK